MNFAIYSRKSYYTENSESTKMQVESCQAHIDRVFPGECEQVLIYEDDGYIRSNMDRPGMNQLRRDVEDGLIDCVVIYRIDRVSSVMMDFCAFYTFLKDRGVKFITVKEGIDTNTPMGEAMMYLAVIFSSIEITNDTMRITDNMNHLAAAGWWCGGQAPLGYKIQQVNADAKKSHKILVPDPEALEYKKQLIDILMEKNFSLQQMETYCRNEGLRSPAGKHLSTTTLHQILTSPYGVKATAEMYDYYAGLGCQMDPGSPRELWDGSHGILVYGRTWERMVDGKKKHGKAPASNWRISIGRHEPVMDPEEFFAIMSHFGMKKFSKVMKHDTTLMKGVLRCKCGRLMSLSRKKKADGSVSTWYHCPRRERYGVAECDSVAIKADVLDNEVLAIFKNIELDPDVIYQYTSDAPKKNTKHLDQIAKRIKDNDRKLERLAASLADIEESTAAKYVVAQMEKLDQEQIDLKRQRTKLAGDQRRDAARVQSLEEKREEITRLLSDFDNFTIAEKNEIARAVVQSAVWDNETLFLTL